MTENMETKVAIHEEKINDHERRIRIQEENSKHLAEISQYVKLQTKHNERQEKQIDNITEIMQNMQTDVAGLKKDMGYVKGSVSEANKEIDGLKEDRLRQSKKFKDKSVDFYLKIISGLILAGLVLWMGLK